MVTVIILFLGTFWEASMDIIGQKRNYEKSIWKKIANYFDERGVSKLGNQFWDNEKAWANKWKNLDPTNGEAFLGSSTLFVPFMDGWHLTKFMWLMHVLSAIIMFEPITEYLLLDGLILYFVFGAGHEIFWRVLSLGE